MNEYATHLPILEALEPKPKRVLEFGTGLYSTPAFLDMPSVTKLVSIETEPGWRKRMSEQIDDKRWTLLDGSKIPPLKGFDLVFIDDGQNAQHRAATIAYVLRQKHPKVVIHDAEHPPYRATIEAFTKDFKVYDGYSPYTAVVEAS